jgi:hypothetical protein
MAIRNTSDRGRREHTSRIWYGITGISSSVPNKFLPATGNANPATFTIAVTPPFSPLSARSFTVCPCTAASAARHPRL